MSYTFNDYFSLLEDEDIQGPQLILFSDISTGIQLLQKQEALGCTKLFLADIIEADDSYLPMPEVLVPRLAEKIQSLEGRVVVSGIDAYLSLLHPDQNSQFVAAIKNLLDAARLNAVFLMHSSELIQNYFKNPRYEDGLSVVRIKAAGNSDAPCNLPSVKIVSDKWAPAGDVCTNYRDLLIRLNRILTVSPDGAAPPEPFTILALRDLQHSQAGMGTNVSFCLELPDIAQQFYGLKEAAFSLQTLEVLLPKCKQSNEAALEWLERTFGKENINSGGDIFKRALELPDDCLWEAYLWMLQKTITPGTYAAKVLSGEITHDTLLKRIVVDTALEVLDEIRNDPYKKRPDYAAQRARTLQKLDYNFQALVDDFVNKTQSDPNALEFLNGKRDAEFCEIIRRTGKTDLIEGTAVAEAVKRLYPALGEYLWPHYGYGDKMLDDYFQDYRRLKFQNRITPEFVQRAFDATVPVSIENRDLLLNELLTDEQAGVLVVDGMGAEYYPFLLGLAKQYGLKIESSRVVSVNLPTKTEFNPLSRTPVFDTIYDIDTIGHDGADKYKIVAPEENLRAALHAFETKILRRIHAGLIKYSRLVVTSDHGSSRLAVLANNQDMAKTLPLNGDPLDWRYTYAVPQESCPPELESRYYPAKSQTYWIVRGYNRFPKKGPKLNELHGGATLEERLVPFVVFTRSTTDSAFDSRSSFGAPVPTAVTKKEEQIIEKDFGL